MRSRNHEDRGRGARHPVLFESLSGPVLEDDVSVRPLDLPQRADTAHEAFLTREALKDIARVTVKTVRRLAASQPFAAES